MLDETIVPEQESEFSVMDNPFTGLDFAKRLVRFLHSTGQIKENPTDAEIEACWDELTRKAEDRKNK